MFNLDDLQQIKASVETFNALQSSSIDVGIVLDFFRSNQGVFRRTRLFTLQCDLIFQAGDERQACLYLIRHEDAFNTFIGQLQMTLRFFENVDIDELSHVDGDLGLDQCIENHSAAQDDVIVVQAEGINQSDLLSPKNIVGLQVLVGFGLTVIFGVTDFLLCTSPLVNEDDAFFIIVFSFVIVCTLSAMFPSAAYDYFKASTIPVLEPSSNPTVVQAHLVESNDPVPDPIIVHSAGDLGSNSTVFQAHLVEDNDMRTNDR